MFELPLTMLQSYKVPQHSKHQPGDVKRSPKAEDGPVPGHVNHGDEEVLQISENESNEWKNAEISHLWF